MLLLEVIHEKWSYAAMYLNYIFSRFILWIETATLWCSVHLVVDRMVFLGLFDVLLGLPFELVVDS